MPLNLASIGEENMIMRVGGPERIRKHLEDMGFVSGSTVTVISEIGGNLIVKVKGSRIAISKEMAGRIMV